MKILYYYWNENTKNDCVEALSRLGHIVYVWAHEFDSYTRDSAFLEDIKKMISKEEFDCIFSFNYFPLLSDAALDAGIPYISWVYDSPHYTLEAKNLGNSCNHVFLFDYALFDKYSSQGITTVDYMPLPVNTCRLSGQLKAIRSNTTNKYKHDISFVGSLYKDEYNFYEQINYLPDRLKGFIDGIIESQRYVYGLDFASALLTAEDYNEIGKYVKIDLGNDFNNAKNEIIRNMIRKQVTVKERESLLKSLGDRFNLDLYSKEKPAGIRANYLGTVDYIKEMPEAFATSKINLNISLRSILTGIPLRIVDILGAGGFCLTNYQAELSEYFENGRELVWFDSPEDLINKAEYYLTHDDEREQIAANGREAAEKLFSYDVLLTKILAQVF
ncbi:MAG: glycosyltransferase [Lachnospiraceae bacterium]|nr:glycosyltransferase [Lachnospiraceae bacterium]